MRQEEQKKREGRKRKVSVTFKHKTRNHLEILLSAQARTSQANILHLDQKAAKC